MTTLWSVIPAEAGIQSFFSFDVLQLFYERTYLFCQGSVFYGFVPRGTMLEEDIDAKRVMLYNTA